MGILRTWLALLVVFAHLNMDPAARGVGMSGGALMAVQLFFMISGFYMAMVWHEKYQGDVRAFYRSRALRLLPLYWVILAATLLIGTLIPSLEIAYVATLKQQWAKLLHSELAWLSVPMTIANVTFLGLDTGSMICTDPAKGQITLYFASQSCNQNLVTLTVVPQAWSLGLEVAFYALCPFIFRAGQTALLALFVGSLVLRGALLAGGFSLYQWDTHLLATELAFFLAGSLAYHFYAWLPKATLSRPHLWVILIFALVNTVLYAELAHPLYYSQKAALDSIVALSYYSVFAILIPFVFALTKDMKLDRWIGELSYPIYITHIFALFLSMKAANALGVPQGVPRFAFHTVVIIGFAAMCTVLVVQPLEAWRQGRAVDTEPAPEVGGFGRAEPRTA